MADNDCVICGGEEPEYVVNHPEFVGEYYVCETCYETIQKMSVELDRLYNALINFEDFDEEEFQE